MALDALEKGYDLLDLAADYKSGNALGVALASADELALRHDAVPDFVVYKPILAMLEGDGKDILVEADGAVFSGQSSESLCEAIKTISNMNKKDLDRLGKNNFLYYQSHLTTDKVSRDIEAELLNKPR